MRLWHESLIAKLPRQQLLGQHRECCALRGNGWGKRHSTVDYVFDYSPGRLAAYHIRVMQEMERRGYQPDQVWYDATYRGKNCKPHKKIVGYMAGYYLTCEGVVYREHDDEYLAECLGNSEGKGVVVA